MPVLPWLAAPPAPSVRRAPPLPLLHFFSYHFTPPPFPPGAAAPRVGSHRGGHSPPPPTPLSAARSLSPRIATRSSSPHYGLRTSETRSPAAQASDQYIDDKLQHLILNSDDLRQIVLLTDGMDTRPYRLSWPRLSVVYDVSPGRVFSTTSQQLRGAGAKISRNCVVLHTSLESPDLQEGLCKNGFNGNRPSLWVLQ
ncbi:hypothetical protein GUJ93_ZPchr1292g6502, partial [Zizania palustris]